MGNLVVEPTTIGTLISSKPFADIVAAMAKSIVGGTAKHVYNALTTKGSSLQSHIQATFDRCTKVKTLLNRDQPVSLLSIYVNVKFRNGAKAIDDFGLIEKLQTQKRVVISGTGGGGKTIFMKYLWISLFENPNGRVPIFVELRRLNEGANDRLDLYIFHSIIDSQSNFSQRDFEAGIRDGKFVLILDGFDEIEDKKKDTLERQILSLAHNNPELTIVVSGRSDPRFSAWQAFSIFHVIPFSKAQTVELIGKLQYDRVIRKKFSDRVKADLYDKHRSFLSNPLLTTMMLLTFDQFADIPEKIHLFYDQAFDTLFAKHDATKEAYKRRMYTELSIDVFKRIFSYFFLATYYDEKFEVSDAECLSYIQKSFKIDGADIAPEKFLQDLTESVCMLQRDGTSFVFVHRSFQEYFAAYFLARISRNNLDEILRKISRRPTDNVIKMLYDIDQDAFEKDYVLPNLRRILSSLDFKSEPFTREYSKFLKIDLYVIKRDNGLFLSEERHSDDARFIDALRKIYPKEVVSSEKEFADFQKIDSRVLKKQFGGS